jgi:(p)ppGpp synthase/HD superfamily hydrolase
MSLPLHAVTEVYGEAGLRERFAQEIARFGPDAQVTLRRALDLAARLHHGDRRVREPYLNHLLRVAIRVMCHYRVADIDVLVAALLHDAVEDHPEELAGGAPADPVAAALGVLDRDFGPRVARLVKSVTNPRYNPERDADEQYREHLAMSLARDPWARVIKASDFTDNGVGVIHTTGKKARRAATKYRPVTPILRDLVSRPDTPLGEDVKRHIMEQFDLAEARFTAILGEPSAAGAPAPRPV